MKFVNIKIELLIAPTNTVVLLVTTKIEFLFCMSKAINGGLWLHLSCSTLQRRSGRGERDGSWTQNI